MQNTSEKLILAAALLIPLLLVVFVLPWMFGSVAGTGPGPTPEVLGALTGPAESPSAPPAARPAASPSASPSAAPAPAAATPAATSPSASPTPVPTPWSESSPDGAVRDFYALVGQHQFAAAARLWSPAMQAAYPPAEYIDRRFAQTQRIVVNSTQVTSVDDAAGRATVKVDLTELTSDSGSPRHLAGSWGLVHGGNGWLLDQPSFP